MSLFNFKSKKQKNKLPFFVKKNKISFLAYEILKKFVIDRQIAPEKLDFVFPQNWTPKILKDLSPQARNTLYRLSDNYYKNKKGLICQKNNSSFQNQQLSKTLSKKAKLLLDKINNNESRYDRIDMLIKKYKINKVLD
tara:strand:+ start:46 stop:459 length:414 start_codon:yes stop_codon:yes gene_type:complete